jgi:PEGA domain
MGRGALLVMLAAWAVTLSGCVERRFVVNSEPPGALVLRNGKPIGFAPADDHFVYYGSYHFTLIKDGYATLQVDQKITRPWYEYFPVEILSEIFWPFRIEDVRRFSYHLEPIAIPRTDELLSHANVLRERGKTLGPGGPLTPVTGTPPPPGGPVAPVPEMPSVQQPPPPGQAVPTLGPVANLPEPATSQRPTTPEQPTSPDRP